MNEMIPPEQPEHGDWLAVHWWRMRGALPLSALVLVSACASTPPPPEVDSPSWKFLSARYDANHDGRIVRAEYLRSSDAFGRLDADGDGAISGADFDPRWDGVPRIEAVARSGTSEPAKNGRWIGFDDFVHGEGGPGEGDPAPLFRLATTDGEWIELAGFRGKKPVALVFGSYT